MYAIATDERMRLLSVDTSPYILCAMPSMSNAAVVAALNTSASVFAIIFFGTAGRRVAVRAWAYAVLG